MLELVGIPEPARRVRYYHTSFRWPAAAGGDRPRAVRQPSLLIGRRADHRLDVDRAAEILAAACASCGTGPAPPSLLITHNFGVVADLATGWWSCAAAESSNNDR